MEVSTKQDEWISLIKISESIEKVLNPGRKKVYRLYDQNHMAKGDYICLDHESLEGKEELILKHPTNPLKSKSIRHFTYEELHKKIFENGRLVYEKPSLPQIREYHQKSKSTFWEEYLRLEVPEVYPVVLSDELRELKEQMIAGKNTNHEVE
ncbi:hypothetical protein [Alkalicoccobacillus plakortidis]|uniref:nicotinate phosphoribosyltransferase n=1 Tax=Alkalicoccobacillus plakortidis TaxID=444060 RepID=A0ABT0XJL8_9BACI|nr:hypothetical protein [Alkalicoccobacillus plakortidis]MCM2676074.1 hypothetical protein [Alkalicoccobacillus plakortidis]